MKRSDALIIPLPSGARFEQLEYQPVRAALAPFALNGSDSLPSTTMSGSVKMSLVAVGLVVLSTTDRTEAQSSNATCLGQFNWMNNSRQQNPCLVAAYLQGACNGGDFTVDALQPSTHYTGPTQAQANSCQCSSVTYSLISACAICQNRTYIDWSSWDTNCSTVYPKVFPDNIPTGTTVPAWAYLDVTASDTFNVTAAQGIGDSPESTAVPTQTTATALPSSTAASGSPTSSSHTSHTGAIAGGVVGGVVGLAAVAGVIIFFALRRRRTRTPPSASFNEGRGGPGYTNSMYSNQYSQQQPSMTQPRLYDPSDPSTFPPTDPTPTIHTTNSNFQPSHPYSPTRPGQYSGAPEI